MLHGVDLPGALGALGSAMAVAGMSLGIWGRESRHRHPNELGGRVGFLLAALGIATALAGFVLAVLD